MKELKKIFSTGDLNVILEEKQEDFTILNDEEKNLKEKGFLVEIYKETIYNMETILN